MQVRLITYMNGRFPNSRTITIDERTAPLPEDGFSMPGRTIDNHQIDPMGRAKVIKYERIDSGQFYDSIRTLEARLNNTEASRWVFRGLIPPDTDLVEIDNVVDPRRVLEQTCWPTPDGSLFVWLAANSPSRVPSLGVREGFINDVASIQRSANARARDFSADSLDVLQSAVDKSWIVECYDPQGNIGNGISDPRNISEMLQNVFYIDRRLAEDMAQGVGYSDFGHYIFALKDSSKRALCMYMLALWPWGIEGTYTIVNPAIREASRESLKGAASFLMLVANSVVNKEFRGGQRIFGESNLYNCPACMDAGFEIAPPETLMSGLRYTNVVWSDNPINKDSRAPSRETPSHLEDAYYNYVVVSANLDKLRTLEDSAIEFIR